MDITKAPRLAYCAAWFAAALYNTWRDAFSAPLGVLLLFNAAYFTLWALLGLIAIPLIRRYPLRLDWKPWAFHLAVGAVFTQVDVTAGLWIGLHVLGKGQALSFEDIFVAAFKDCFHVGLMTYWGMVAIVQALDARRSARRQEMEIVEHKAAYVRAQLQTLKSQLQPHFLFNTLHAVSSLMHYDVATADRMLNRLADLLRLTLQDADDAVVTLDTEVNFIEAYLEIEKIRFEHRLAATLLIPAALRGLSIPSLILQPLVENAIKHGVAPRAAGGRVIVRAYQDDDHLVLEVEDDAPEAIPAQPGFGIGLSNTRSRLETLYGAGRHFELIRAGMGTIARIRLPNPSPAAALA
jgi:two-component system, LytTR family, sensor kinase